MKGFGGEEVLGLAQGALSADALSLATALQALGCPALRGEGRGGCGKTKSASIALFCSCTGCTAPSIILSGLRVTPELGS